MMEDQKKKTSRYCQYHILSCQLLLEKKTKHLFFHLFFGGKKKGGKKKERAEKRNGMAAVREAENKGSKLTALQSLSTSGRSPRDYCPLATVVHLLMPRSPK